MKRAVLIALGLIIKGTAALAYTPLVTDSRIRTFVYNENEVFPIGVSYGYQTNIEFARNEEPLTISLGDPVSWQITPIDNRLFIKASTEEGHTNMTIITNKRAYQFELTAVPNDNDQLIYVARFYYPDKKEPSSILVPAAGGPGLAGSPAAMDSSFIKETSPPSNMFPSGPVSGRELGVPMPSSSSNSRSANRSARANSSQESGNSSTGGRYNFNYRLEGPDALAPVKVFDDGRSTYFRFEGEVPSIAVLDSRGVAMPLTAEKEGVFLKIPSVHKEFVLRRGPETVNVYNEANLLVER